MAATPVTRATRLPHCGRRRLVRQLNDGRVIRTHARHRHAKARFVASRTRAQTTHTHRKGAARCRKQRDANKARSQKTTLTVERTRQDNTVTKLCGRSYREPHSATASLRSCGPRNDKVRSFGHVVEGGQGGSGGEKRNGRGIFRLVCVCAACILFFFLSWFFLPSSFSLFLSITLRDFAGFEASVFGIPPRLHG